MSNLFPIKVVFGFLFHAFSLKKSITATLMLNKLHVKQNILVLQLSVMSHADKMHLLLWRRWKVWLKAQGKAITWMLCQDILPCECDTAAQWPVHHVVGVPGQCPVKNVRSCTVWQEMHSFKIPSKPPLDKKVSGMHSIQTLFFNEELAGHTPLKVIRVDVIDL